MNSHLLFCSDLVCRNTAGDRVTGVQGWCLGSAPVRALFLSTGAGKFEPLVHGFLRPDVHKEFPLYPNGERSGFRSFQEFDCQPGAPGTLYVLSGEHPNRFEERFATFCERPFSEIMIRDQEEVLPSPWHGKTLGRLSEGQTLSEIFLGEKFTALRRNMLKPEGDPDCARCPIKTFHLPTAANN